MILSTHIVEDIGQTCGYLPLLARGRVLFRGDPGELTRPPKGQRWTVVKPPGDKPGSKSTTVSMLHRLAVGIQYRLVGEGAEGLELLFVVDPKRTMPSKHAGT